MNRGRRAVRLALSATSPQQLLHFVELAEFSEDWNRLGLQVEDDLWELQSVIMRDPKAAPVIEGTGGLRKLRFAPDRWKAGKSGGIRVCYAFFEQHWIVLLVMAYGKTKKESLSAKEKSGIKSYLAQIKTWLDNRHERDSASGTEK